MGVKRKTKSLKLLLEQFENEHKALSVVELIGHLDGKMSKTTVYRLLERLEDDGELYSITSDDGLKKYLKGEGKRDRSSLNMTRPYFQCYKCGKTEILPIELQLPVVSGHKIESASLIVKGSCKRCI